MRFNKQAKGGACETRFIPNYSQKSCHGNFGPGNFGPPDQNFRDRAKLVVSVYGLAHLVRQVRLIPGLDNYLLDSSVELSTQHSQA